MNVSEVLYVVSPAALAAAALLLCLRPERATLAAVFILYTNLLVVWSGILPAALLGGVLAALLALPLAYHVLIRRERLTCDITCGLMLLLLGVMLASSLLAIDPWSAARRVVLYLVEGAMVYWLTINVIRTRRTLTRVMGAVVVAAAFLATLSIYQSATHSYDQEFGGLAQANVVTRNGRVLDLGQGGERAAGPVGDPNRYAQILLVAVPLAVYLCWRATTVVGRAAWGGAAALVIAGVLLTFSRGAMVTGGLLITLLGLWGYVRPRRLVTAALVLALAAPFVAPRHVQRLGTVLGAGALFTDRAAVESDRVIRGRATEMLASLLVFRDHPILGVGPAQYMPFYSQKYQAIDAIEFRDLQRPRRAHTFLEIGAELGAVGLALYVGIVATLLVRIARARRYWTRRDPALAHLAAAFSFSLLAYVGTAMFLHIAYERYFWFLLGVAGAAVQVLRSEALAEDAKGAE